MKKTLKEGEDGGASLEKQTKNLDIMDYQNVEKERSMNTLSSMLMVERLTTQPILPLIQLVN